VPPFEEILCRGRFRHPSGYRQTSRVSTVCTRTRKRPMRNQRSDFLETCARKLLDNLRIQSIPVPVDRVARALGAQIRFSPLDEELSGLICIKDGVPIIGVNTLHHPNRQRFTVAHEIAHLQLHRDHITSAVHVDKRFAEPVLRRDSSSATGTEWLEIEANHFASALLMPKHLEELAKKFQVSKATLQYRIRNLSSELRTRIRT
jgi:hypothetical protein